MALLKPKPYVHPNKRKRQDAEACTQTPTSDDSEEKAIKRNEEDCPKARPIGNLKAAVTQVVSKEEKVTIRLQVRLPQKGQLPLYDEMIASKLSHKQVVLGMLTKGLRSIANDATLLNQIKTYEPQLEFIETRRTIKAQLVTDMKGKFDQYDILSERALGQKIGEALLTLADLENRNE